MIKQSISIASLTQTREFAAEANECHRKVVGALRNAIQSARKAGDALRAAKEQIRHGSWGQWLQDNFEASPETARVYMRISENWHQIAPHIEKSPKFGIEDARRLLRHQKELDDGEAKAPDKPNVFDRKQLLRRLEAVRPGLARKPILEHSDCFIFKDHKLITYNDDVSCSCECDFPVECAVQHEPFLRILRRLDEKYVTIESQGTELVISGHHRKIGLKFDPEIRLAFDEVQSPTKWLPLKPDFCEAVKTVCRCTGNDPLQFDLTCVHFHPDYLESCNNHQMMRYEIQTPLKSSVLIKSVSFMHIAQSASDMMQFSENTKWFHFKNKSGLILSCRVNRQQYREVNQILAANGTPIRLPKGLAKGVENARVFSSEDPDDNLVRIRIKKNRLEIRRQLESGWYRESFQLQYDGPSYEIFVRIDSLLEIARRFDECQVAETGILTARDGELRYAAVVEVIKKTRAKQEEHGSKRHFPKLAKRCQLEV